LRPAQDLLHLLARDHRRLDDRGRALLSDRARRTPQAVVGYATDVLAHEAAEQLLLHPLVAAHVTGGPRLSRQRTEEEAAVERHLRSTLEEDPDSAPFTARLAAFHAAFVEHTDREELEVFPALRHVVSRGQLRELGRVYATLAVRLPTRWRCSAASRLVGGEPRDVEACDLAEIRRVASELLEEVDAPTSITLPQPEEPRPHRRRGRRTPGFAGHA
jgi:hypothetical protein